MSSVLEDELADGSLRVWRDGGVATVTLNRPERHNAINLAMWEAFTPLMASLAGDATVDVVVLRGPVGGPFSAGADISEFTTLRSTPESAERYGEAVTSGERAIMTCPKPTVAVVEGFAIGGGAQVALACDLRMCTPAARFGITPAKLGIVYALQSTARLVEVVGPAWASWILMTGELVDAATALRVGLVHEVVEDLEARATALTATLSGRARVSLLGAKALIRKAASGQREEDEEVRRHYHDSLHGPEYAEGVQAFLAKREPDFRSARQPG
ncbi:MAG TPA: enoyl-CoA hydratase-related protein [Mycobacteriales bacterium]|nr:enoyl-CoA hydratase-related protein [Mycobacteriales bacterium]